MKTPVSKIVVFVFLFCFTGNGFVFSQEMSDYKTAGIGFSASSSVNGRMPGMALTPYFYYRPHQHMVFLGMDLYPAASYGKIRGFQMGYRYFIDKGSSSVYQFYFEAALQVCKFGNGIGPPVPYKFLPEDSLIQPYNLLRSNGIVNVYGAGVDLKVTKKLRIELTTDLGFNYLKSDYTPTNVNHNLPARLTAGSKIYPVLFGRIAAYVLLYRKHES